MDQAAILDHDFVVAAYVVTWVIQLSYLAWLGLKWRSEKRNEENRTNRSPLGFRSLKLRKSPL